MCTSFWKKDRRFSMSKHGGYKASGVSGKGKSGQRGPCPTPAAHLSPPHRVVSKNWKGGYGTGNGGASKGLPLQKGGAEQVNHAEGGHTKF